MKQIFAKFNSKCAETSKRILRGDKMIYDYGNKKAYHLESNAAISFLSGAESNNNNDAGYIQAHENAGLDNIWDMIK